MRNINKNKLHSPQQLIKRGLSIRTRLTEPSETDKLVCIERKVEKNKNLRIQGRKSKEVFNLDLALVTRLLGKDKINGII